MTLPSLHTFLSLSYQSFTDRLADLDCIALSQSTQMVLYTKHFATWSKASYSLEMFYKPGSMLRFDLYHVTSLLLKRCHEKYPPKCCIICYSWNCSFSDCNDSQQTSTFFISSPVTSISRSDTFITLPENITEQFFTNHQALRAPFEFSPHFPTIHHFRKENPLISSS